jgi:hypothetical protein
MLNRCHAPTRKERGGESARAGKPSYDCTRLLLLIEQGRIAVLNGDIDGALMGLEEVERALRASESATDQEVLR